MAPLTYRNSDDERADKAQQERLLAALDAWDRALRRDENAAWIIRGKHGTIRTLGDPQRAAWAVYAQPASTVDPEGSARAWGAAKHKLACMLRFERMRLRGLSSARDEFLLAAITDGRVVERGDFAITAGANDDSCYAGSYMMTWVPQPDNSWKLQMPAWQDIETELENCK